MDVRIDDLIARYLALLDTQPRPEARLCGELMQLYRASQRLQQTLFFAGLAAPEYAEAAAFLAQYQQDGAISLPVPAGSDSGTPAGGVVCCAANQRYFPIVLNLIASLHRHSLASVARIVVGDLGLADAQRAYLGRLARVEVWPVVQPFAFQQWKFPFVLDVLLRCGQPTFYLDAGCQVEADLGPWFARVAQEGQLCFYNGPYDDPQHRTRHWTSEVVYQALGLRRASDDSVTAITTLFGLMPERAAWLRSLCRYNDSYLLRPHADCIDNRFDQSLFAVWCQTVPELPLQRFESELRNAAGYGASQPRLTVHASKFRPGSCYPSLLARPQ